MADYDDGYWWSRDGLRLHYRDYAGPADRPPILCIPGLTRNARDFEAVADRLAGDWRIIGIDLRGRGESAYSTDPMTYVPLVYLQDLDALIETLAIDRFIGIGTSLGGLMLMLLAATGRHRIVGALLNDIGPEIDASGLARVRQNTGNGGAHPTWMHAARALAESQAIIYPDYTLDQWLAHAKRLYRLNGKGRIVLDYDQRIAEPFRAPGGEAGVDLWPAFDALARSPLALLRGEFSDLLAEETVARMSGRAPEMDVTTVAGVGHAPALDEAESIAAIDRLLARTLSGAPVA